VYLDNNTQLLKRETGLNRSSVSVGFDLDTSAYDPAVQNQFTLFAEATDTAGNTSTQSLVVHVALDQAPVITLVDSSPEEKVTAGGLCYQTLKVADDSGEVAPINAFAVYTSFADLDLRAPQGLVEQRDNQTLPYMSFTYPEAAAQSGRLMQGSRPLFAAQDGKLLVYP